MDGNAREMHSTPSGSYSLHPPPSPNILYLEPLRRPRRYPSLTHSPNSKFAFAGFTESLSAELPPAWNISFLVLELGGVETLFAPKLPSTSASVVSGVGHTSIAGLYPAYSDPATPTNAGKAYLQTKEASEHWMSPEEAAECVWGAVERKRAGEKVPLRLPLGSDAWGLVRGDVDRFSKELDEWRVVSEGSGK